MKTKISQFLALLLMSASTCAASERPNIILMITDDQGYGDLGVTGNPVISTPSIDAMSKRSAKMSSFYVSPVCAPTRASLMTGRHAYRTRVVDTWKGRAMMEPAEMTVAEVLRDQGYRTGIFGKWHLGDCYPMRPNDQGFQESLVHSGGGLAQPSEPVENERRYTDPILFHNGEQVQKEGYCTDIYFNAAMEFIEEGGSDGDPFFIYLATNAPHGPFHDVPVELYEKYKAKDLSPILLGNEGTADTVARAFAMIENIDQNVGRLMGVLEEKELIENTMIIFMVDNGPNTKRYVGNMRGSKSDVHEGGIRSPFYVQWPARLSPETSSDRIASHIDVMPTLLEAAGLAVGEMELQLDGRSLLPLLEGNGAAWEDREIVIQAHRGDVPERYHHFAIRDQQFKLMRPSGFGRESADPDSPFELYEIAIDPREENNVFESHPEVVTRLKSTYDQWFDDVSTTRPDNFAPPRIVVGTEHETRTLLTQQDWRQSSGNGWGENGKWLLHIAEDATFDVTVLLKEEASGHAELRIGDSIWARELIDPHKEFVFPNVALKPGDAALTFELRMSDHSTLSAYHITMIKR